MPNAPPDTEKWKCQKCGELHEEEFDQCWNCLTQKPPNPEIVVTKSTPSIPSWITTNAHAKYNEHLINRGILITIISGITWFMFSSLASISMLSFVPRFSPSSFDNSSNIDDAFPIIWLPSMMVSIAIIGVYVGIIMVILGYAKLFLKKQAIFEQNIKQLHFIAHDNATQHVGETSMGDQMNISNSEVNASAIGSSATLNMRDISIFQNNVKNLSNLDNDMKEKINLARTEIEKLILSQEDKDDIVDDLEKFTKELDRPNPNSSRIERFLNRIKEIAPTISSILMSAKRIIELIVIPPI